MAKRARESKRQRAVGGGQGAGDEENRGQNAPRSAKAANHRNGDTVAQGQ